MRPDGMLENDLREPIVKWLEGKGLSAVSEFHICHRIPDVMGVRDGIVKVAVELKLSDWKRALNQASVYRFIAERSYVAMPSTKQRIVLRNISAFRELGIGALMVREDDSVLELIESRFFEAPFSHL